MCLVNIPQYCSYGKTYSKVCYLQAVTMTMSWFVILYHIQLQLGVFTNSFLSCLNRFSGLKQKYQGVSFTATLALAKSCGG